MGAEHEASSPVGDNPSLCGGECHRSGGIEPVRDEQMQKNAVGLCANFRNDFMPDDLELRVTVNAPAEPGDEPAAIARLRKTFEKFIVHFEIAAATDMEAPGEEQVENGGPQGEDGDVELEFIFDVVGPSSEGTRSRGDYINVTVDPVVTKGKQHVYRSVAPTTRASARVRAHPGNVSLGIMKGGVFRTPPVTNETGGGWSPTVVASSHTPTTFHAIVTGNDNRNTYTMSVGWHLLREDTAPTPIHGHF